MWHHILDDYREVAPGCWLAFRQAVNSYESDSPEAFLASHSEQIVTEAVVNRPLPAEMFHIELVERRERDHRLAVPIRRSTTHITRNRPRRSASPCANRCGRNRKRAKRS